MEIIKEELIAFFSKAWIWLIYILVGIIGKISHEYLRGNKMSWGQIFAFIGCALFAGILVASWCDEHYPALTKYLTPLSTLLARELFMGLFSINYRKIFADLAAEWTSYWANKFKK